MFNYGSGRGRGRGMERGGSGNGMGYGGNCVCTKCNYTMPHQRGTPCTQLHCPKCGNIMTREGANNYINNARMRNIAIIDKEKCTGCKICMGVCPVNAMKFTNGKVEIIENKCIGCMKCISVCPVNAISEK